MNRPPNGNFSFTPYLKESCGSHNLLITAVAVLADTDVGVIGIDAVLVLAADVLSVRALVLRRTRQIVPHDCFRHCKI